MFRQLFLPIACFLATFANNEAPTMLLSGKVISGRTLEEVYGKVDPVKSMTPRTQHLKSAGLKQFSREEYAAHRTAAACDFPIELVIVQDSTESFADDIANMRSVQLQLMVDALAKTHPGSAYSVVSFRDKPLWPLGEVGDYCVRFGAPLSPNVTSIVDAYGKVTVSGGGDPPEAQFTAIVAAAQSATPGWGSVPLATRLMVVVTDAAPHFEGDGFNVYNLAPYAGSFDEANNDAQCIRQYYPNPATVRSALSSRGAYLASLVYGGSYDYGLPIESWQWVNAYLGQTEGFIYDIESDSSNFWERLSKIVAELENVECGLASTPSPATTATVTPAPPAPTTDQLVTPVGTLETTAPTSATCPPCPPCESPEGCPPCCREGVLIQLKYRPARLHLEVEN